MGQEGEGAAREEGQRQMLPGLSDTGWGANVEFQILRGCPVADVHTTPLWQRRVGEAWIGREEAEVMVALVILILCVMGTKYSPSTVGHHSDDTQSNLFCLFLSVAEQPLLCVWACPIAGTRLL